MKYNPLSMTDVALKYCKDLREVQSVLEEQVQSAGDILLYLAALA